jgi:5-methylcytosine-specific restriction endonuclease McrA
MGKIRKFASHNCWDEDEISLLNAVYVTTPRAVLTSIFPKRNVASVEAKANALGLSKTKKVPRTPEQVRAAKREQMARLRARDPETARRKQRAYLDVKENRDRMNARRREWHIKRFFYSRANRSHFRAAGVTARQLASLWKQQRGVCALTGERLDRSAEIDHCIPIARGGPDTIDNLRWVSGTANRLKRDLTDAEPVKFCGSVVAWIGRRIIENTPK